jgi:hypothetical protein
VNCCSELLWGFVLKVFNYLWLHTFGHCETGLVEAKNGAYLISSSTIVRLLRFGSWKGWLFAFTLGSVLFAMPPLLPLLGVGFSYLFITASIFVINQYFDSEDDKFNLSKKAYPSPQKKSANETRLSSTYFFSF